ncbi:hypothetical protein [Clostridium sp. BL-8]|uniref:hypothetical protein n=1 Tax=Clostridium sp. BL-8 TaxID=349938 RepID=UPI00098BEF71|nr:hypothetical protein [Clostridium sp. BL-8]OOM79971.1 hypothetical protein CLOBL_13390 [Clostridium sp. BL-8]
MNVILCGLEKEIKLVEKSLKKEHKIIKYIEIEEEHYDKLTQLKKFSCDYFILAVGNRRESEKIIQFLLTNTAISEDRIIDFFEAYTGEKVDNIMQVSKGIAYDGIILGLSHAAYGIRSEYLDGKWCNLSNGSQDLYYDLQVLKKCINNYKDNISKLKFALLEMYDYVNFNWDTSVSRMAVYYYAHGGCMEDLHRFPINCNFNGNIDKELTLAGYYSSLRAKKYKKVRGFLFDNGKAFKALNVYQKHVDFLWYSDVPLKKVYSSCIDEDACDKTFFNSHIFNVRHEDVVDENYKNLLEILKILKEINPDIKIILLLMPRYYTMEKLENISPNIVSFKEEFEKMISLAKQKYEFEYCNFKNHMEISYDNKLYYDVCHLNYSGAVKFTQMLNSYLKKCK